MYSKISDLPTCIQSALVSVEYFRKDIDVEVQETVSISCGGSDGRKAFTVILNMSTGESEILWGSWGGANMFNDDNRVDLDHAPRKLTNNVAVIKGSKGYKGTFATVFISPENVVAGLLKPADVSIREKRILSACRLVSSYKKEELKSLQVTEDELQALVQKGFLKKDGRGISVTTEGKNAIR